MIVSNQLTDDGREKSVLRLTVNLLMCRGGCILLFTPLKMSVYAVL